MVLIFLHHCLACQDITGTTAKGPFFHLTRLSDVTTTEHHPFFRLHADYHNPPFVLRVALPAKQIAAAQRAPPDPHARGIHPGCDSCKLGSFCGLLNRTGENRTDWTETGHERQPFSGGVRTLLARFKKINRTNRTKTHSHLQEGYVCSRSGKTNKTRQSGQKRTTIFRRRTDSFDKIEFRNISCINRSHHFSIRIILTS